MLTKKEKKKIKNTLIKEQYKAGLNLINEHSSIDEKYYSSNEELYEKYKRQLASPWHKIMQYIIFPLMIALIMIGLIYITFFMSLTF